MFQLFCVGLENYFCSVAVVKVFSFFRGVDLADPKRSKQEYSFESQLFIDP